MHFEIMRQDRSVYRFRADNVYAAIETCKSIKGISLIKTTRNGMPIGKYDFTMRRMVKWG
jgi:uncharacterized protein YegP (UPF0339 family)